MLTCLKTCNKTPVGWFESIFSRTCAPSVRSVSSRYCYTSTREVQHRERHCRLYQEGIRQEIQSDVALVSSHSTSNINETHRFCLALLAAISARTLHMKPNTLFTFTWAKSPFYSLNQVEHEQFLPNCILRQITLVNNKKQQTMNKMKIKDLIRHS
jgi:hypothetical protein